MSENKTGRYFKYAIGEIVLVVIGILIALQINNWNEDRKTKAVEISYLKRLLIDLEKDKILWKLTHDSRQKKTAITQNIIAVNYSQQKDTINYLQLAADFKTAVMWSNVNPNQHTFSEMLSSGNLDLIKNDSIKIKLLTLNNNYTEMANWDKTTESIHARLMEKTGNHYNIIDFAPLSPIFSEYTHITFTNEEIQQSVNTMTQSFSNLIKDQYVINNLDIIADNYHRQLSALNELESKTNKLIELIKDEISTRTDD